MAGEATTIENDPILNHHFEMAGIKEEPQTTDDEGTQKTGDDDGKTTQADGTNPEGGKQPEGKDTQKPGGEQKTAKSDSNSGKSNGAKEQGKKEEGQGAAGPGDLTLQDGSVVKAGKERRFYESMQVARQQAAAANERANTLTQQLQQAQQRIQTFEQATQAVNGVDPVQAASAIRLYRDLASNPVGTVQKLLAELKAQGHNIEGIGAGVDTAAIQQMIDQRLQGVAPRTQQGPSDDDLAVEVGKFFAKYPDAVIHDDVLAQVITKNPSLSNEEAYFQLKNAVIEAGLDWSKPLAPQWAAKNQQPNGQQTQQTQQNAPLTNGRTAQGIVERSDPIQPEGETTDDIVRAAMREAGLKI